MHSSNYIILTPAIDCKILYCSICVIKTFYFSASNFLFIILSVMFISALLAYTAGKDLYCLLLLRQLHTAYYSLSL